ncbi:MAG: hypothetical protein ACYTF1_20290, partial [Planctomycetota bacterium]
KQFTGWLNWCDPTQPLVQPTDLGESIGQQYQQLWGSPGQVELEVYPHILSIGHSPDALYLALESDSPLKPAPRLILLDENKTGYINVRHPGKIKLHEISINSKKTKTVQANRKKLTLTPGYQDLVRIKWND